jgi:hypothetical protein
MKQTKGIFPLPYKDPFKIVFKSCDPGYDTWDFIDNKGINPVDCIRYRYHANCKHLDYFPLYSERMYIRSTDLAKTNLENCLEVIKEIVYEDYEKRNIST